MLSRIYRKKLINCDNKLIKEFRQLSFSGGYLSLWLDERFNSSYVFYILDKNKVVAWAMLANRYSSKYGRPSVGFYVKSSYRRRGLGLRLAKSIVRFYQTSDFGGTRGLRFGYAFHDSRSEMFFQKCKIKKIFTNKNSRFLSA